MSVASGIGGGGVLRRQAWLVSVRLAEPPDSGAAAAAASGQ